MVCCLHMFSRSLGDAHWTGFRVCFRSISKLLAIFGSASSSRIETKSVSDPLCENRTHHDWSERS